MILSIDPGLNFCGLAVIDTTDVCKVIETHLVKNARKFTPEEKIIEIKYGNRPVKINSICKLVLELLDKFDIEAIAFEAPFFNRTTPASYSALLEVITVIKYKIVIEKDLIFKATAPKLIKQLFSNDSTSGKLAMLHFLETRIKDGSILYTGDIQTLSEHEVDAIAVGFSYMVELKTSELEKTK